MLYLTLRVTVATAKRSFSKLKLMKNYLRSTMCEKISNGLGILSVENDRVHQLNKIKLINNCAKRNTRERNLNELCYL